MKTAQLNGMTDHCFKKKGFKGNIVSLQ